MDRLTALTPTTTTEPRGAGPTAGESSDLLASYFSELGRVDLMSREDELAAANNIVALRERMWRTLLGYLPLVEPICLLARELLPAEVLPKAALDAVQKAARALKGRELQGLQRTLDAACDALAAAMARVDVDGVVSDRVLADLRSLAGGQAQGLSMKIKLPRKGSLPFTSHVMAAQASYQALWTAKDRFVRANLRLVVSIARRFNHGRLPLHDLIQEGNIGLMKAVDRFDPSRGFRFSTYGSWWIRHAISRALASTGRAVRLPVHMIEVQQKLARLRRAFATEHGREPADAELAEASGVSVERIQRMRWSLVDNPVSLDQPIGHEPGLTLLDALEDTSAAPLPEQMYDEAVRSQLQEAFDALPPMEAEILRKRLGLGDGPEQTLKEIGECYALSRERIRQIQEQALGRLRREFKRRDLM
jgi:RNA polymerase primary sigma factor